MLTPISDLIRNVLSFTVPVKQKLLDLNNAIEKGLNPEQILTRAKGVVSLTETAVNLQNQQYMKYKDSTVPSNLVPDSFHGTPTIGNILKEAMDLYKSFKTQAQNSSQIKFLPGTIKKLVSYFDAITETFKKSAPK